MNKLVPLVMLAITLIGCRQSYEKNAQKAVEAYALFVDSIYDVNEAWRKTIDTDYVEMFLSPHDLTQTKLDTIITLPENKKSLGIDPFYKARILDQYMPLKAHADRVFGQLDLASQQRYKQMQKKFESLLVE